MARKVQAALKLATEQLVSLSRACDIPSQHVTVLRIGMEQLQTVIRAATNPLLSWLNTGRVIDDVEGDLTAKGLENVIRKVIGKVKIAHVTCQSVDDALQGLKQRLESSCE